MALVGKQLGQVPDFGGNENPPKQTSNNEIISFLEEKLSHPFLDLLTHVLNETNGFKKKSIESCLADFRSQHKNLFYLIVALDGGLRGIFVSIVVIVSVRALGIGQEIKAALLFFQSLILPFCLNYT